MPPEDVTRGATEPTRTGETTLERHSNAERESRGELPVGQSAARRGLLLQPGPRPRRNLSLQVGAQARVGSALQPPICPLCRGEGEGLLGGGVRPRLGRIDLGPCTSSTIEDTNAMVVPRPGLHQVSVMEGPEVTPNPEPARRAQRKDQRDGPQATRDVRGVSDPVA